MKTLTVTFATLLISAMAWAHSESSSSAWDQKSTAPVRSGSSTVAPLPGNTMNDHDKMLEMCRSLRTDRSCDEIMKDCESQVDRQSCMHKYMK